MVYNKNIDEYNFKKSHSSIQKSSTLEEAGINSNDILYIIENS